MPAIFQNRDPVIVVDSKWIDCVKRSAQSAILRRARLNLHLSTDDQVQEMLIAFCKDSLNAPHRHIGKSESIHVIEGRVLVVFFHEDGTVSRRIVLGPFGTRLPHIYRLASPEWHTVVPLDELVVIHEVTSGPFQQLKDDSPLWIPEDTQQLRLFIDNLRRDASCLIEA
jgi:cupin fold WbuC family metalloprotein